ncbi:MAG: methyltransferase domain-containing protein [Alphaproteobacteria bacterium]|nr:methyltransferase domain-containing protein [Alphaproteobacteria bacterium]
MDPSAYKELADLEGAHWWFVGRRRIFDALLDKLDLAEDARILEIGCGTGGNLEMLARHGALYAAEYDDGAREIARARKVARDVAPCRLPDEIPFSPEKFDLIVLFDVLEHIEDDVACLKAIRARMSERGWLVVTVPAFQFLWSGNDEHNHHFRRYTRARLEAVVRAGGFGPAYASYFNFWLFPAVAAVRFAKNAFFKDREEARSDLALPTGPLNNALAWLFSSERVAMGRFSLPFGVSCILSARPAA